MDTEHVRSCSHILGSYYDELGDERLKKVAVDLVVSVRNSAAIDRNLEESVRAGMRFKVRRLLARHGYPPDLEETAIDLVLEQVELFARAPEQPRRARTGDPEQVGNRKPEVGDDAGVGDPVRTLLGAGPEEIRSQLPLKRMWMLTDVGV